MNVYIYIMYKYPSSYLCLCISEMNDSNETKGRRRELGIFCHFKELTKAMR